MEARSNEGVREALEAARDRFRELAGYAETDANNTIDYTQKYHIGLASRHRTMADRLDAALAQLAPAAEGEMETQQIAFDVVTQQTVTELLAEHGPEQLAYYLRGRLRMRFALAASLAPPVPPMGGEQLAAAPELWRACSAALASTAALATGKDGRDSALEEAAAAVAKYYWRGHPLVAIIRNLKGENRATDT